MKIYKYILILFIIIMKQAKDIAVTEVTREKEALQEEINKIKKVN